MSTLKRRYAVGALKVLAELNELCIEEQLDKDRYGKQAFDGVTALLLSPEKLDLWERRLGYGKTNSTTRIARIRQSCEPLKMPYAPVFASEGKNDPDSPDELHEEVLEELDFVEHHEQHVLLWKQMLKWEVSVADQTESCFLLHGWRTHHLHSIMQS